MSANKDLHIAIIGAGIAGLSAALALQRHPNIHVQIYERATELREIGASIALGPNGLRTLEKLGIHEALGDDIGFRNPFGYPMIYRHWKTNEVVSVDHHRGDVEWRHRTARFYRVHLQQALLASSLREGAEGALNLGKGFENVYQRQEDGRLAVRFTDGTTIDADILLGADGIKSAVRQHFVPSSAPKWTGWVPFRAVFEADRVAHIPGVLDEAYHFWGPDRTFFSSPLGKGLFTIVAGHHSDPHAEDAPYKDATWSSNGDLEVVKRHYADWHPVVQQMIAAAPSIRQYPNTFASSLDTWVHGGGRVTFAGDAAHAHGGAFAAGGSLAVDDAYAFALAIWHVLPPGENFDDPGEKIAEALGLYERTRKAHTDRVLAVVHQGNTHISKRIGKVESDEELRARMMGRSDPSWIHEHDVEATFANAVAELYPDHPVCDDISRARL